MCKIFRSDCTAVDNTIMKLYIQRDLPAGARKIYVYFELPAPPVDLDQKKSCWLSNVKFTVTDKISGLILDKFQTYGGFEITRPKRDLKCDDKQITATFGVLDFGHGGSRTFEIKGDLTSASGLHYNISENRKMTEKEKDLRLIMHLSIADHEENGKLLYTECIQIL